jgi:hypothetical protein
MSPAQIRFVRTLLVVGSLALPATSHAQGVAPARAFASVTLDTLGWMSGCWRGNAGPSTVIEEQYSAPTANQILGATRYVRTGRSIDFEFTSIASDSTGITLNAQPRGVPPTPFELDSLSASFARWSNPHHDFPQRIQYTRLHRDTLVARIEGPGPNGAPRASEWRLTRVKCVE